MDDPNPVLNLPKPNLQLLKLRLERAGVNPDYSGWIVIGLAGFFFMAATNTLAGWLYLMSGIMLALLAIAIVLARRSLYGLEAVRSPIPPVHAGDFVYMTVTIINHQPHHRGLLQAIDPCPPAALRVEPPPENISPKTAVSSIAGQSRYRWSYRAIAPRRGIFRWSEVTLRTAAPLGLMWYRQSCCAPARLVVYPRVISLSRCPMLDNSLSGAGQQEHSSALQQSVSSTSTGLIRSLRPYRWGDPMRLVHWRSSARYGELRSRELEDALSHHHVTIALDLRDWESSWFEQAITVAASLLQYGLDQRLGTQLWTASTGTITDHTAMMETLAQLDRASNARLNSPISSEISGSYIGITANLAGFFDQIGQDAAQRCQRWLLWPMPGEQMASASRSARPNASRVVSMQPDQPLQPQIQQ